MFFQMFTDMHQNFKMLTKLCITPDLFIPIYDREACDVSPLLKESLYESIAFYKS
jgi:hypothetical protein